LRGVEPSGHPSRKSIDHLWKGDISLRRNDRGLNETLNPYEFVTASTTGVIKRVRALLGARVKKRLHRGVIILGVRPVDVSPDQVAYGGADQNI
jgi:hypothetical protein